MFFFFTAPAPTEIYTLSLHDALPIYEHYEVLFARGIDPDSADAVKAPTDVWPSRAEVQAYGARADAIIEDALRSEEHTSELQSHVNLVCRLLLEKKKKKK